MGPKKKNTRQASKLLVSPCELPVADLPTLREILGKCTTEKNKLANNSKIAEVCLDLSKISKISTRLSTLT